jgi:hypothetical protein
MYRRAGSGGQGVLIKTATGPEPAFDQRNVNIDGGDFYGRLLFTMISTARIVFDHRA